MAKATRVQSYRENRGLNFFPSDQSARIRIEIIQRRRAAKAGMGLSTRSLMRSFDDLDGIDSEIDTLMIEFKLLDCSIPDKGCSMGNLVRRTRSGNKKTEYSP